MSNVIPFPLTSTWRVAFWHAWEAPIVNLAAKRAARSARRRLIEKIKQEESKHV